MHFFILKKIVPFEYVLQGPEEGQEMLSLQSNTEELDEPLSRSVVSNLSTKFVFRYVSHLANRINTARCAQNELDAFEMILLLHCIF